MKEQKEKEEMSRAELCRMLRAEAAGIQNIFGHVVTFALTVTDESPPQAAWKGLASDVDLIRCHEALKELKRRSEGIIFDFYEKARGGGR